MEDFENALINLINESQLPFEAKRYVVLKVVRDVEDAYQAEKKRRAAEQDRLKEFEKQKKENEVKPDE